MKEILEHYADYDRWANERFVERLEREPEAVLDRQVSSSFPSLRATILHIRDAENTWWGRITGTTVSWPAEASNNIDGLLKYSERLQELVKSCSEAELRREFTYADLRGNEHTQPVWQALMHCLNHSTQHRGQLITMMRSLGLAEIPANDLVVYQRSLR
jgi:uncharacterized damage-inducible protein DinB